MCVFVCLNTAHACVTSCIFTSFVYFLNSGDLVLSGEGHSDWISDVQFHPSGTLLATSSGDGTVKVWDFERSKCSQTFAEHQQPGNSL